MSDYFNLISGLDEHRLVELGVNRGKRFWAFPEFPGSSEGTCPPHDGTNLSSCSTRRLSANVHKSICGFGDSWLCFCSMLAEKDIGSVFLVLM